MNQRIYALLEQLYDREIASLATQRIMKRLTGVKRSTSRGSRWQTSDVLLIAYGDSVRGEGQSPLRSLKTFLRTYLPEVITQVHLLPFFPYTSDDGFAVSDYMQPDPNIGSWSDIQALSDDVDLVFDLVINHASSQHPHFLDFLNNTAPGNDYFFTAQAGEDVSQVTRPRASPLLQAYETKAGRKHVWCTFSRDQVDWNFSNPEVLLEFVDIFITYLEKGATWLRLDAVAYLWKELGTNCIHRPQTHAVVKLLRVIGETVSPDIKILTETNVPLPENLSYFGDGDEAHIIYNFSLPPLLVHALLSGSSAHLSRWCRSLPELPAGCTYLNFIASHDGIGLRPAEGVLGQSEIDSLVACIKEFGGRVTERMKPDGSLSPYEANISLFDAFKGTLDGVDSWQVPRFLVSQYVMASMAGVPALYYNSVLATPNNLVGLEKTGRNRTINRRKWTLDEIDAHFENPKSSAGRVLNALTRMLEARSRCDAFHPEALQECLDVDQRIFALMRTNTQTNDTVVCVFNLTKETVSLDASAARLGDVDTRIWSDGIIELTHAHLRLGPYSSVWLSNTSVP